MKKIIPTGQHRTLNINQRWLVIDALTGPISMQIAGLAPFELSGPQLLDMLGYTSAKV